MQFHLNGFRPGDPEISEAAGPSDASPHSDPIPEEIDVLIVGCGPAGLTLAAQLAACPDSERRPSRSPELNHFG
jgi:phenol 2-monooxygenase (NADPH)